MRVVRDRRHKLVASHPDVTVDPPQREHDLLSAKRAVPSKSMLVVGIDESAVEVEQCSAFHPSTDGLEAAPCAREEAGRTGHGQHDHDDDDQ